MKKSNTTIEMEQVFHLHRFYRDVYFQRLQVIIGNNDPRWQLIRKATLDAFGNSGFEGAVQKFVQALHGNARSEVSSENQ